MKSQTEATLLRSFSESECGSSRTLPGPLPGRSHPASCPECGEVGRTVNAATIVAQVRLDPVPATVEPGTWRVCRSPRCRVVYFHGTQVLSRGATLVTPFHKSSDPDRLVCFCFRYTARAVLDDHAAHGRSTIAADIRSRCGRGEQDCIRKNPEGRCCLGNVGALLDGVAPAVDSIAEQDEPADERPEGGASCCASKPKPEEEAPTRSRRSLVLSASAAAVTAILSSACCWLPLAAALLGVSSAGAGAFFEAWRTPMLVSTGLLIGSMFLFNARKSRCETGATCAPAVRRVAKMSRSIAWLTTAVVAGVAFFPQILSATTSSGEDAQPSATTAGGSLTVYRVSGMHCAGCEGLAVDALTAVPGLETARVSYPDGTAHVTWSGPRDDAAVFGALEELGYSVSAAE
ncbi:MAG: cation transporter [Myxococcales bacterium]|nr:cation transporter [Myxococcales bacterium]